VQHPWVIFNSDLQHSITACIPSCNLVCRRLMVCRWLGKGVSKAVDNVNKEIAPALLVRRFVLLLVW